MTFWKGLPIPFLALAPLEDVTDIVFREIVSGLPRPDVFFTEFTSADGLASHGREKTIQKLKYTENQRPIVAQIWGTNSENMYQAAKLVKELQFDGVDINMGCPDNAVVKKGAGAAMANTPSLAKEIIEAVRNGSEGLAVSVKTRLGFDKVITEEWIPFLLEQKLDALTVHGRIAVDGSKYDANWEEVGKAVGFINEISPETVLIGNGDIKNYNAALEAHKKYGVDGVMIGRGIFTNPWVFEKSSNVDAHNKEEFIALLLKHVRLYDETWGSTKNFEVMKKFFKMYVRDFEGASELRQRLMKCKNRNEVEQVLT